MSTWWWIYLGLGLCIAIVAKWAPDREGGVSNREHTLTAVFIFVLLVLVGEVLRRTGLWVFFVDAP